MGDVLHANGLGAEYEIRDGQIITTLAGTPFEVTVYVWATSLSPRAATSSVTPITRLKR